MQNLRILPSQVVHLNEGWAGPRFFGVLPVFLECEKQRQKRPNAGRAVLRTVLDGFAVKCKE
jgi:hypothetical protein